MITPNMTKPPCVVDGVHCDKRYIACQAACEKYAEWLEIHAEEKARIDAKRNENRELNSFIAEQGKRTRTDNQRKYLQRKKGNIRREVKA